MICSKEYGACKMPWWLSFSNVGNDWTIACFPEAPPNYTTFLCPWSPYIFFIIIYFLTNYCPVVTYQTIKHDIIVQFSFRFKLNQNYTFTVEILTIFLLLLLLSSSSSRLLTIWSIQTNFEVPIRVPSTRMLCKMSFYSIH